MTVVAATAVVADILDTEEFQALVVFFASSRHWSEFVASPAIEGRRRSALIACAPTAPSTAAGTRVTRTTRLPAALGRGCGAARIPAAAFNAAAAATTPACFTRLTVFRLAAAGRLASLAARRFRPARVAGLSGGGPPAIPNRQRRVISILIGTPGRPFATIPRRLAAIAVSLRPDADLAVFPVTSAAAAAAAAAPSSASPRCSVRVAVTVSCRLLSLSAVIVLSRLTSLVDAIRRIIQPPVTRVVQATEIFRIGGPAVGSLFAIETSWQRSVAAFFATFFAASASAATAAATTASAAALALFVVSAIPRCGSRFAAVTRLGLRSFADGPGSVSGFGPRSSSGFGPRSSSGFARLAAPRPLVVTTLLRGRFGGLAAAAKGELVLLAVAAAGRRFDYGPRGCRRLWAAGRGCCRRLFGRLEPQ